MKLKFDIVGKHQPDPYIFEDNGKLYLYVTAHDGVEAYSADDLFGVWHYEGIVASFDGRYEYWAPSVAKLRTNLPSFEKNSGTQSWSSHKDLSILLPA